MSYFFQLTPQTQLKITDIALQFKTGLQKFFGKGDIAPPYISQIPFRSASISANTENGSKAFELSNHLGNVLAVVSDKKRGFSDDSTADNYVDDYKAEVVSVNDYYPFGMAMPERSFDSPKYSYGFNGKEKDESGEWGELTHYDYGFRIYNPGIGRFLSVDPLTSSYPMLTPYQFASNTPIQAVDVDGKEGLLGAIIGAGVDLLGQVSLSVASGKSIPQAFREVDYFDVGTSAAVGFLSPTGAIQAIHRTTSKIVIKGAKELSLEILKSAVDYKGGSFDFVGAEGSDKTFSSVVVEGMVSFGVNRLVELNLTDQVAEVVSRNARANLRSASEELVSRTKIAERAKKSAKTAAKRIQQKNRRVEVAQAAVSKAEAASSAMQSFTPVLEVFGNGVKELSDPLIVAPVAQRIDETIQSVKSIITFSGDRKSVTVEKGGSTRIYLKNDDSGEYVLKNKY